MANTQFDLSGFGDRVETTEQAGQRYEDKVETILNDVMNSDGSLSVTMGASVDMGTADAVRNTESAGPKKVQDEQTNATKKLNQ